MSYAQNLHARLYMRFADRSMTKVTQPEGARGEHHWVRLLARRMLG